MRNDPPNHPFLDHLTAPLRNKPECRARAEAMLQEAFDPHSPAAPLPPLPARATSRKLRMILPWAAACIALVLGIFANWPAIRTYHHISNLDIFNPYSGLPAPDTDGLGERERLLLGEPGLDPVEQRHRLHLHDPENPAYYMDYAVAYLSAREELPPGFLDTAARIAPDNAAFLCFAAAVIGRDSYEKLHTGGGQPREVDGVRLPAPAVEANYEITNEEDFHAACRLLSKAAELPEFRTYWNDMALARLALLPSDSLGEMIDAMFLAFMSTSHMIHFRGIADLISARAEMLSKEGDSEAFITLTAEHDALKAVIAENQDLNLVNELVYEVKARATDINFHAAAERLELQELTGKYLRQRDGFQTARDTRDIRRHHGDDFFDTRHMPAIALQALPMIASQVESPPPLTGAELKPLRLAEHAFLGSIAALALLLAMLLAGTVVALSRFIIPRHIRHPASRLAALPGTADMLWIIIPGAIAPVLLHFLIMRHTPLGGRDYGLHTDYWMPAAQYAALLLTLLIAPPLLARWRLSPWLAALGVSKRVQAFPLVVLASSAIWILAAYPMLTRFGLSAPVVFILAIPLLLFIGLLFTTLVRMIKSPPPARLARAAAASAALPAYAIAAVAMIALIPAHQARERHWVVQDTLIRIDPMASEPDTYEFRVAAVKRAEIKAILGIE